jgi:hypothetical protein
MKIEKTVIILSALTFGVAHALSSSTAELRHEYIFDSHRQIYLPSGRDYEFDAYHAYNIDNKTGATQTVKVCYRINVCANMKQFQRTNEECENVTIPPGENRNGKRTTRISYPLQYNPAFPYKYICKIYAQTEISDPEKTMTIDNQQFGVSSFR